MGEMPGEGAPATPHVFCPWVSHASSLGSNSSSQASSPRTLCRAERDLSLRKGDTLVILLFPNCVECQPNQLQGGHVKGHSRRPRGVSTHALHSTAPIPNLEAGPAPECMLLKLWCFQAEIGVRMWNSKRKLLERK